MAAVDVFGNNCFTALVTNVVTTPAAGTLETWQVDSTTSFPQIGTGGTQQFRLTIGPPNDINPEIVICTQVLSASQIQVSRGAEGSPIKTHGPNTPVTHTLTAGAISLFLRTDTGGTLVGPLTLSGNITATNVNGNAILGPLAPGNVALRPQGSGSATNQFNIAPNGAVTSVFNTLDDGLGNAIISGSIKSPAFLIPTQKNLLSYVDSTFEGSIGTWAGSNMTVSDDATKALDGSHSMKMVTVAPGAAEAYLPSGIYPVVAGTTYVGVVFLQDDGTHHESWHVYIAWYNASGVIISQSAAPSIISVGSYWQASVVTATAPAGAVSAIVYPYFPGVAAAGESFWVDQPGLFPGDTLGYRLQVLSDVPVAYFPLTDAVGSATAVNVVGSGDLTTVAAGAVFGQSGFVASDPSQTAASFDGVAGRMYTGPVGFAQATNFSIILDFASTSTATPVLAMLGTGTGIWWAIQMGAGGSPGDIGLTDSVAVTRATVSTFNDGLPHRVVITMGSPATTANITIYVDGVQQALTGGGVWQPSNPASSVIQLGSFSGPSHFFPGTLGQVAVYNTVLTAAQVAALNTAALNTAGNIVQKWIPGDSAEAELGDGTLIPAYRSGRPLMVLSSGLSTRNNTLDDGAGNMVVAGALSFSPATTAVAPAAGGAGALPATPTGYATVTIGGVARKVAYY